MFKETLLDRFPEDVAFACGDDAASVWEDYRTLRDRLVSVIDKGRYAEVDGAEVGTFHKMLQVFEVKEQPEFLPALTRISIDKDYYGKARLGMGDILALRSIEDDVADAVTRGIARQLSARPLILDFVTLMSRGGRTANVQTTIALAEVLATRCLQTVVSSLHKQDGGLMNTAAIANLCHINGLSTSEWTP